MKQSIKQLYNAIPFKKAMFSAVKKVWNPSETVFRHLHFHDTISVNAGDGQIFKMVHYGHSIENELFWQGLYNGWEKYSMRVWAKLAQDAGVIFDIGANTGVYSLVAKAKNPAAAVHAFEPFPAIYNKMTHNMAINAFDVKANCQAITNYTGKAVIYTEDENFAYSVTVNQNLWAQGKDTFKIDIDTITLKDYIEQNNIRQIDLMKIDVETHEPEVMQGFADYFLQFKPLILIEILNDSVAGQLNQYFEPGQFDFYNIDERTGIKKVDQLSKSDYYNFLIVPKEKAHLYDEKSIVHFR